LKNFEEKIEKYAEVAIKNGINIQKDQKLVINAPIESVEFVRLLQEKAYEAGASNVYVEWNDEKSSLIKYKKAPDKAFEEYPEWKAEGFKKLAEEGAAFLSVVASDPDLLKDVDPKRISKWQKVASQATKDYREIIMSGKISWSVVSTATDAWAKKVFPNLNKEERIEKLWEKIFQATRIDQDDPVEAWEKHMNNLKEKLNFLNKENFKSLHFKNSKTDLNVGLAEDHVWIGGGMINKANNALYIPNMPTEEVFTAPDKNNVNGIVYSSLPLNYGGNLIEGFYLKFEDGKIVDFGAEKNENILKDLIDTDEGSKHIGEVALVPVDSPISNTKILFFNTLYDENASCHLAIGRAYPYSIKEGSDMSKEELSKKGANDSLTHVDFMIGTENMEITGIKENGEKIKIFENGNWVI